MSESLTVAPAVAVRDPGLDRLRGLAVALMVVDHVCIVAGAGESLRVTLTRAAMPLFFLVAGHLFRRLSWRHGWAVVLGVLLPSVVPWIADVDVLVLYGWGVLMLAGARALRFPCWVLPVLAFGFLANWPTVGLVAGYTPLAVLGLLSVGALLPRSAFGWAWGLPASFGALGRYPLSVYAGHLLALEALRRLLLWL